MVGAEHGRRSEGVQIEEPRQTQRTADGETMLPLPRCVQQVRLKSAPSPTSLLNPSSPLLLIASLQPQAHSQQVLVKEYEELSNQTKTSPTALAPPPFAVQ